MAYIVMARQKWIRAASERAPLLLHSELVFVLLFSDDGRDVLWTEHAQLEPQRLSFGARP